MDKVCVADDYNSIQYHFIECEFKQIYNLIIFSSYILNTCKIFRKLKINNYDINQKFKFQVFVIKNYA